ncbi:MAG: hypothetical protein J0M12_02520 [Deltaproteobacteria bacterium]|nr:hypothetical protein [Deltaproteobacteria bacterium]
MNIFNRLAFCAGFLVCLSGCLRTSLTSTAVAPKVFNLAAANRNPLHLEVSLAEPTSSLGNQYVLIAIPFGRIDSDNVIVLVQRALYTKLALRGYTPLVSQPESNAFGANAQRLSVTIKDPQASAFDLLVTRHLSCSLDLKAQFSKQGSYRLGNGEGSFEHFGAFAFQKEMSLCFTRALDIALDQLLNDLRM